VTSGSVVLVNAGMVAAYAKLVSDLGAREVVDDWLEWYMSNVRPSEIMVPHTWMEALCTSIPKAFILLKFNALKAQYLNKSVTIQSRPLPDVAKGISGTDLTALGENGDLCNLVEGFFGAQREKAKPILEAAVGAAGARRLLASFEVPVTNMALNKAANADFEIGVAGKLDKDKLEKIQRNWVRHVSSSTQSLANLGVDMGVGDVDGVLENDIVLVAANFDGSKFVGGQTEELEKLGFSHGVKAALVRRITVTFKAGDGSQQRKDIQKDTLVSIMGYSAPGHVVIEVQTTHEGASLVGTVAIKPENLALADGAKQKPDKAAIAKAKASAKAFAGLEYVFGEKKKGEAMGNAEEVELIRGWEKWLVRNDGECQMSYLKNTISFELKLLTKVVPSLSSDDITLVKRVGGGFEVWTHRNFAAGELVLCPEASEIKTRMWTQGRSALLKLGKSDTDILKLNGDGRNVVIDGRLRSVPQETRAFSLFWVVQRAPKNCNMAVEFATISCNASLNIPGSKKRAAIVVDDDEMPAIPMMFNPKPLPKGTQLLVDEDREAKRISDKDISDRAKAAQAAAKAAAAKKAKK
jgi:hypothetical protein